MQRLQIKTEAIGTHLKIFEKLFTKRLCRHRASRCSGRWTSSQEVRVRKELILSTVSSATSASCISSSWWQLSLITYTMRPTQMKMRRIIPITCSTKEFGKTVPKSCARATYFWSTYQSKSSCQKPHLHQQYALSSTSKIDVIRFFEKKKKWNKKNHEARIWESRRQTKSTHLRKNKQLLRAEH